MQAQQIGGKMKRKSTKRKQQHNCPVAKAIGTVAQAASAAEQIYRAVEPIVKTVLERGTKIK